MANYKANKFPLLTIAMDGSVVGYDAMAKAHILSEKDFASDISVGPDGTLWVVSTTPDPDEGGNKIYWSDGDSKWNEISDTAPGGFRISGCENGSCVYITNKYELYSINEAKQSQKLADNIYEVDYGGGYYWAMIPKQVGAAPVLLFASADHLPLQWTIFKGDVVANSPSATDGVCLGLVNEIPTIFDLKTQTQKPVYNGIKQTALQISSKTTTNAILSFEASAEGNEVLVLSASPGVPMAYRPVADIKAIKVTTSYFIPV